LNFLVPSLGSAVPRELSLPIIRQLLLLVSMYGVIIIPCRYIRRDMENVGGSLPNRRKIQTHKSSAPVNSVSRKGKTPYPRIRYVLKIATGIVRDGCGTTQHELIQSMISSKIQLGAKPPSSPTLFESLKWGNMYIMILFILVVSSLEFHTNKLG
jgi:hypothetical protein